jgi:hypothetical protein
VRILHALALLFVLSGCGGGSTFAPSAQQSPPPGSGARAVQVQLVITIPQANLAARKRPHYVSPSTESLTLLVQQAGQTALTFTMNLQSTSPGCAVSLGQVQCSTSVQLFPGMYTATISTFDGTFGGGNLLSSGQNLAFTVSATGSNTIPMTLSGVPASILVTPLSQAFTGTMVSGFVVGGMVAQPMSVVALDADGNYIVGQGSPTMKLSTVSGTGWTVTNPPVAQPNVFTVEPPIATSSTLTLQVTATYPDATCSLSGAVCTATFSVKNDPRTLFVFACHGVSTSCIDSGGGAVFVYAPPYTGTPITITAGIDGPSGVAVDALRNLYVANWNNNTVTQYAPPYTGGVNNTLSLFSIDYPSGVSIDPIGDIVVSFDYSDGTAAYRGFSTSDISWFLGGSGTPVAIDANGNVFTAPSVIERSIVEFSPPNYGPSPTRTIALPASLNPVSSVVVNGQGTVYASTLNDVAIAPAVGPVEAYFEPGGGNAYYATYDPSGNAVVASTSGVQILSPQAALTTTITQGVSITNAFLGFGPLVACDNGYDIFVANSNATTVTVYELPYAAPSITIALPSGYAPVGVVLGP